MCADNVRQIGRSDVATHFHSRPLSRTPLDQRSENRNARCRAGSGKQANVIPAKESSPIRHTYILGNKYKLELCGHSEFNRLTSRGRGSGIVVTQWNAGDYAKNSQGQFAWALTLMERMDFAP